MDTAWILIGCYLNPIERIRLSRLSSYLHSLFSSHTDKPHWCSLTWKEEEIEQRKEIYWIQRNSYDMGNVRYHYMPITVKTWRFDGTPIDVPAYIY